MQILPENVSFLFSFFFPILVGYWSRVYKSEDHSHMEVHEQWGSLIFTGQTALLNKLKLNLRSFKFTIGIVLKGQTDSPYKEVYIHIY